MRLRMLAPINVFALAGLLAYGQVIPPPESPAVFAWPEEIMAQALPSLVQIAIITHFFLALEEHLELPPNQREQLQQMYFAYEAGLTTISSRYQLARSERVALLSQRAVDMKAIEVAVRKEEKIRSEVDIMSVRYALEAIRLLNHKQHMEILLAVRNIASRGVRTAPQESQKYH